MPEPSVLEVCIRKGGVRKGTRVATFIVQWAICAQALGREPTQGEYTEYWKEPERSSWRQRAEFREIFPALETPQVFADAAAEKYEDAAAGLAALGRQPATL